MVKGLMNPSAEFNATTGLRVNLHTLMISQSDEKGVHHGLYCQGLQSTFRNGGV